MGTFDETRKELTEGIKKTISKTRLSLNETDLPSRNSSTSTFSLLMAQMNSIPTKPNPLERDEDKLNEWLRFTSDELRFLGVQHPQFTLRFTPSASLSFSLLVQDRMETQWPLYTAFYYLQLLEIYFENIAERQLLFDFFSISLMALHDKETKSIDPPILSSSDDDD